MWVVVVWVDPKWPDDGIEKIIGTFSDEKSAEIAAGKEKNAEVVMLQAP